MRAWMKKCMALALCAVLCIAFLVAMDALLPHLTPELLKDGGGRRRQNALLVLAITLHNIPEGMAVGQRPVAVMVRAERAGWPQSGLAGADALVEMATQGGQTALMALYANAATLPQVGPVGPLWDQHLQLAMAVDAVCVLRLDAEELSCKEHL